MATDRGGMGKRKKHCNAESQEIWIGILVIDQGSERADQQGSW